MKRPLTLISVMGGIFLFFTNVLFQLRNGWRSGDLSFDLLSHFLPALIFAKTSVLAGTIPLWNPYQAVGRPFFAQMGLGLLYPINWVIFLLDVPDAMMVIQCSNILIGMIGMLFYMRYLQLDWPAIILASALFGYTLLAESIELCQSATISWAPIIIWLIHRLFDKPSFRRVVALALALTFCLLGGSSQHLFYICTISLIYFFVLTLFPRTGYDFKDILFRTGLTGLAFLLMAGLVCVELFSFLELFLLSALNSPDKIRLGANPFIVRLGIFSLDICWHGTQNKIASVYFGSALFLIPFAFLSKRHKTVVIGLLTALIFSLLMGLSEQIAGLAGFHRIPFVGMFRIHIRMISFTRFLVAVLAGIGVSSLWAEGALKLWNPKMKKLNWLWILSIIYMVGILWSALLQLERLSFGSTRYIALFLPFILIVLLLYASKLSLRAKRSAIWIVALFVAFDVASYDVFPNADPDLMIQSDNFSIEKNIEWIKEHAGYSRVLLFPKKPDPNIGNKFQIFNIDSYHPLTLGRWNNFVRFMVGPDQFDHTVSRTATKAFYGLLDYFKGILPDRAQMLGLTSLRYIVFNDTVYENEFALPRAYLANSYIITQTEEESLQAIKDNISELSSLVILENARPSFSSSPSPATPGQVRINRYRNNDVDLSATATNPSLLVLTDSHYPGWHAFVDGIEKPIWRANSLFRAVEVPPGRHTVLFTYQPASLRWGAAISLGTLSFILAGLILERHCAKVRQLV